MSFRLVSKRFSGVYCQISYFQKLGFISRFRSWLGREAGTGGTKGLPEAISAGPRTGALDVFMADSPAMKISTVMRCVKLLSESVAVLPMRYMRLKGGIFVADMGSRLNYLLNVQPDPNFSAFDFWRRVVQLLLLEGNAYIVPVYDPLGLEIARLVLCSRGSVSHDTVNDRYTVADQANGLAGVFGEDEVIHLKGLCAEGDHKRGVSVLTYARLTVSIASTGARETLSRFSNGGNVRGFFTTERGITGLGEIQDEEMKRFAERSQAGFSTDKQLQFLPKNVDFKQISLNSTDMQFLETCKFTVRELCRFFGVHPSFVFDDTSNNYKSAEMANVAFLSTTLNPILRNIECELLRKLVDPSVAMRRLFQFDRRGLHACDLEGKTKYYSQLIGNGIANINEIRRFENMPPVDGGDCVLVSANYKTIQALSEEGSGKKKEVSGNEQV